MRSEKQRIQEELLPVIEALLDVIEPGWETNPDLEETPKRVSKFYGEFIGYRDNSNFTSFEPVVSGQLILVRNIPYFSLCAHHLLPFYGKVTVAYIPNPAGEVRKNKVLGLSKIPRIVQMKAHKPQMQETLASDIADALEHITGCANVAVVVTGQHTCMQMRGIRSQGEMIVSDLRGIFLSQPHVRDELFNLMRIGG